MRDTDPLRPEDPDRIGDHRLTGRLGEGGQGVVYLAVDGDGGRVAVKVLHARLLRGIAAQAGLRDQMALMRRVADFCTAKVLDYGMYGDRPYIVSEYIDGPSLQTLVETDGPLSGGALERLMVGTASALVATHQAGVLHRDFTPHNVLIGPDGPRVIDFGIARALDTDTTTTSGLVGTPAYTAPERLHGGRPGAAADIFGWAATMTFAATGRPPFGTESVAVVLSRILHDEPDLADVPRPLRDVIGRCLAKDPERRPDARDVLLQVLGHAEEEAAQAEESEKPLRADRLTVDRPDRFTPRPPASVPRPRRWWHGRGRALIATGVAIAAIAAIGTSAMAFVLSPDGRSHRPMTPRSVHPTVTVGSANFPESHLLGEIYAQALEAKGIRVIRRFDLGERETYFSQVASGQIQVMPEYNGALAQSLDHTSEEVNTDEVNGVLRRALPPQLEMLASARAEDKDSVTVSKKTADRYHLRTIADLAPMAGRLVMGGSPEFQTRHQGLVGLRGTYGVGFRGYQPFETGDRDTMIQQLEKDVIQAANLFTTEPAIAENHFVVLADPKHLFSAQNVTPLVYRSALNTAGRAALAAVSAKLTTEDLLTMNTKISINKVDPAAVAKDWLQRTGLLG
ncbi:protein kinase [Actinoallomurus purpureus]|uniref:glycine betaine ABC transporter substrate-binding protein n=1 Tax=Actinoallomurus purpureus TaxID=478114 RepID=UPI002092B0D1|nr:glycine betaine ABC transporter substrate-binding protein [Actinoallomurus purpureus]MCO6007592.1 protein kinase [Actinoallomurus purpureus]